MRAPLPRELGERDLRLRSVGEADDHRLLEDLHGPDASLHAAPATAVGLAGGAHARQLGAERLVLRELGEQAALEPPAVAEEPAVVQWDVLGLGHLHRDRLEAAEVRGAAERAAARPDPALHARHVAGSDLAHLDARPELS